MQVPREQLAIRQAVERLAEVLDAPDLAEDAGFDVSAGNGRVSHAVLNVRGHCFVLEWKRSGAASVVAGAIRQLRIYQSSVSREFSREVIPLLAVPYMGEAAQELCARADLAWLDLSGNARIVVPGVFYQNLGNPSLFPQARTAAERVRTKGVSGSEALAH